ncbi:MAG: cation transporter [Bacteroidota bacterium]
MMKELSFTTNIHCGNCVNAVSPVLNQELDIESWEVNLDHPDKILKVVGEVTEEQVLSLVKKAGFEAQIQAS